jgi:hypothetical protein
MSSTSNKKKKTEIRKKKDLIKRLLEIQKEEEKE